MKVCWCNMCGYNAIVRPEHVKGIERQAECPDCQSIGDFSLLCIGNELPEDTIPDDPMEEYQP